MRFLFFEHFLFHSKINAKLYTSCGNACNNFQLRWHSYLFNWFDGSLTILIDCFECRQKTKFSQSSVHFWPSKTINACAQKVKKFDDSSGLLCTNSRHGLACEPETSPSWINDGTVSGRRGLFNSRNYNTLRKFWKFLIRWKWYCRALLRCIRYDDWFALSPANSTNLFENTAKLRAM